MCFSDYFLITKGNQNQFKFSNQRGQHGPEYARKAKELGFDCQGVEPSTSLSKIAIEQFNLNVKNSFFEKAGFPQKHFDIITMIDVFEHVTNPRELLKNSLEVLKDDGILCIKVPNGNYNRPLA